MPKKINWATWLAFAGGFAVCSIVAYVQVGRVLGDGAWGSLANVHVSIRNGEDEPKLEIEPVEGDTAHHTEHQRRGLELGMRAGKALPGDQQEDYRLAAAEFGREVAKVPNDWVCLTYWGTALARQAMGSNMADSNKLFAEAEAKFQKALRIKPSNVLTLSGWAQALGEHARRLPLKEALEASKAAEDKCRQAAQAKPGYSRTYYYWGIILFDRATAYSGDKAMGLVLEGEKKLAKAAELSPGWTPPLRALGESALTRAMYGPETNRAAALSLAREKLLEVERVRPGSASYLLAAVAAQSGQQEECKKWLENGLKERSLPSLEFVTSDQRLDPVKEQRWYKEFLKKAYLN